MNNEENNEVKSVEISPVKKGKRMLVFLADFFVNFMLSFVLFNVMVMPLMNLFSNSTARQNRNDEAAMAQFEILYNNKVMFYESQDERYYYTKNVESTLNCYLSYYSFEDTDVLEGHPQYGNKTKNEVFLHFYKEIRGDYDRYLDILRSFNQEHDFFIIDGENISLTATVKQNIKLSFFSESDMSEAGKKALGYLQDFFLNTYAEVFTDIEKNDLVYNNESYLDKKAIVSACENELQIELIIASFVSLVLSSAIYFLAVPMFSKENKTISMMIMKVVRIGTNNLYLLKKSESILLFIYFLIFSLPIAFFMPMTQVAFTYLFNIVPLTSSLFIGLLIWLISFVVTLVSPLGQSLTDFLSRSVLIKNDDLDAIYRSKGYDV